MSALLASTCIRKNLGISSKSVLERKNKLFKKKEEKQVDVSPHKRPFWKERIKKNLLFSIVLLLIMNGNKINDMGHY